MRLGLGGMFLFHGWPKLAGGEARWAKLGAATKYVGLDFAPTLFGFMAGITETFGGLLFAIGLFFRPACAALVGTMVVAAASHIGKGEGLLAASHAIEVGIVFVAMFIVGPGALSIDARRRG